MNDKKGVILAQELRIGTNPDSDLLLSIGKTESKDFKLGDKKIHHAWYMPIHNLQHLSHFYLLDVTPSKNDPHDITVEAHMHREGEVRIRVFAIIVD
ncbi:hypothetical protein FIV00_11630 [Labrenzia sp. THAF82]|uniref:hypothetical protein n=1 Tax=Labrenzia sp. THAF82 TaxID=2587861 RepID=UPI001267A814|nr:hypothetical protein [Labrenzia sp. THAF82]QFT31130.1 hypothetical protein FIV00_11630 [Labrenzia sp. THAF82]